ncbi:GMC family oxidoreductase N-terminal domain-containing protein [Streptomyces sp. NPDC051243]|uniref:GMC family oxidoreductase N-terminal domain-containing protein n=1 Tax=Streptomyces sp. NPDC051243 TaxID=3365646 RepID=UPI0037906DD2
MWSAAFLAPEHRKGDVVRALREGLRCSTADAYLRPARSRPNLKVLTGAQCTRVLLGSDSATGVEVDRDGELMCLRAERQVAARAGAYNSPQLLMLSGIGPGGDLAARGITPRVDLPVEKNLQDHPHVGLCYLTDTESLFTAETPDDLRLLETEGRGPLTSNLGEAGGFHRTREELDAPDIQVHATPVMFHEEGISRVTDHAFMFGAVLLAPTSQGRIFLRSALPSTKPHILHNY